MFSETSVGSSNSDSLAVNSISIEIVFPVSHSTVLHQYDLINEKTLNIFDFFTPPEAEQSDEQLFQEISKVSLISMSLSLALWISCTN